MKRYIVLDKIGIHPIEAVENDDGSFVIYSDALQEIERAYYEGLIQAMCTKVDGGTTGALELAHKFVLEKYNIE
jgi:hypothetical protein